MHADPLDEAAALSQHAIDVALANRKRPALTITGYCHNCGESITAGEFCPGGECRHDYEARQRAELHRRAS